MFKYGTRFRREPVSVAVAHQEEDWADIVPADPPEDSWSVTDHLLYVAREAVHAVEPTHAGRLDEHHEEYRDSWAIHVQQVHQVHPALKQ